MNNIKRRYYQKCVVKRCLNVNDNFDSDFSFHNEKLEVLYDETEILKTEESDNSKPNKILSSATPSKVACISGDFGIDQYVSHSKHERFPTDTAKRKEWLNAIGQTNYNLIDNDVICSAHFISEHKTNDGEKTHLLPSAVPYLDNQYVQIVPQSIVSTKLYQGISPNNQCNVLDSGITSTNTGTNDKDVYVENNYSIIDAITVSDDDDEPIESTSSTESADIDVHNEDIVKSEYESVPFGFCEDFSSENKNEQNNKIPIEIKPDPDVEDISSVNADEININSVQPNNHSFIIENSEFIQRSNTLSQVNVTLPQQPNNNNLSAINNCNNVLKVIPLDTNITKNLLQDVQQNKTTTIIWVVPTSTITNVSSNMVQNGPSIIWINPKSITTISEKNSLQNKLSITSVTPLKPKSATTNNNNSNTSAIFNTTTIPKNVTKKLFEKETIVKEKDVNLKLIQLRRDVAKMVKLIAGQDSKAIKLREQKNQATKTLTELKNELQLARKGIFREELTTIDTDDSNINNVVSSESSNFFTGKLNDIKTIKDLLNYLQNINLIDIDLHNLLTRLSGSNDEILQDLILIPKYDVMPEEYLSEVCTFVLPLNFYSPKAYKFVLDTYKNCLLPGFKTLFNWYKNINFKPGFTNESLCLLKQIVMEAKSNKNEKIFINIIFDEIPIRQNVEWMDKQMIGYVDISDGNIESNVIASNIFVILIVGINRNWTIPLGYFPIASITSEQRANLIQLTIDTLVETDVQIVGITFKINHVYLKTMKLFNYDFYDIINEELSSFRDQNNQSLLIVNPDPYEMLKLVRNALKDLEFFTDSLGNRIEWKYLMELINLQENHKQSVLRNRNAIAAARLYFHENNINVKLSVQTLSNKLANALDFCRTKLQIKEFIGSEGTSKFLRTFNDILSILTSRKSNEYEYTKLICDDNIHILKHLAIDKINYIKNLSTKNNHKLIRQTRWKIGFLGFIACLKNITYLHVKYIKSGELNFIPFYKLNGTHIDLFYDSILMDSTSHHHQQHHRSSAIPPTIKEFITTYRKTIENGGHISFNTIQKQFDPLKQLNCTSECNVMLDTTYSAASINSTINRNQIIENYNKLNIIDNVSLSEYSNQVIYKITKFCVAELKTELKCPDCFGVLEPEFNNFIKFHHIIRHLQKNPASGILRVCEQVEKEIRRHLILMPNELNSQCIFTKKIFYNIQIAVLMHFLNSNLFPQRFQQHFARNQHYGLLLKCIIQKYFSIRCWNT